VDSSSPGNRHPCHEYRTQTVSASNRTSSASYQHAIDSGVYLRRVDSSRVGARLPVTRDEIGNPSVLRIIGQSNGGNHGETRHVARQAVFNFNALDGLCYQACDPLLGATGDGGSPWCILGDALIADGCAIDPFVPSLCRRINGRGLGTKWNVSAPNNVRHQRMAASRLRTVIRVLASGGGRCALWHERR